MLPFDYVTVADEVLQRLTALKDEKDRLSLAPLIESGRRLKDLAGRLDDSGKIAAVNAAQADAINACLKRLGRLLIPIASTAKGTYGQDPYSLTAQSTVLPSLFELPLLAGGKLARRAAHHAGGAARSATATASPTRLPTHGPRSRTASRGSARVI